MTDPVPEFATGRAIIFYAPHQDDETLFMGQVIAHHALVGRDVHVVLGSDGSTSAMRDSLNGLEPNGYWGGDHYPIRQKIPYLDPAAFAAARDQELIDACAELGVPDGNVHLELGTRGSTIDVPGAEALILKYEAMYPGAGHYTMWWGDIDTTHKNLGQGLRNLATSLDPARKLDDCRWLVRAGQTAGEPYVISDTGKAATARHMARCAAKAYAAWVPRAGRYAIGYHSVASLFEHVENEAPNRIVKTP